jgi:hypothetical protein
MATHPREPGPRHHATAHLPACWAPREQTQGSDRPAMEETVVCERGSAPFTGRLYCVLGYAGALIGLSGLVLLGVSGNRDDVMGERWFGWSRGKCI